MVHRDIKPQNVLIDAEGRAKLTDFGISRQLEQDGMTATGRVLGTTDYVAPEQAMGHGADPRSDIYSLGVVLYEMLIGQVPFHADSQVGVAMKHVNEELPDVQQRRPEVSAAAALVVERATAKEPSRALPGRRRDDRRPLDRARGRGRAGRLDHRRGDQRAGGGAATAAQALRPRALVLGGDPGPAADRRRGAAGGTADQQRRWRAAVRSKDKGSVITLSSATDFDPAGDGEEDPEAVSFAVDGNPTGTAWTSEHYDSPDFAGTKSGSDPGVGLYVTTRSPATPSEMVIRGTPGWDARIYATASGPPEELSEWGEPVGTVVDAPETAEIELDVPCAAKYFLIWFTKAAPSRDQTAATGSRSAT